MLGLAVAAIFTNCLFVLLLYPNLSNQGCLFQIPRNNFLCK